MQDGMCGGTKSLEEREKKHGKEYGDGRLGGGGTGTAPTSSSGNVNSGSSGAGHISSGEEWREGPGDSKIIKTDGDWLYGPQPEMGLKEFFRRLTEGLVCNPGYPCEDMKLAVVPVGEGPLGGRPAVPGPRRFPLGFPNGAEFTAFKAELTAGLKKAGYDDTTPIMQGSSVTGKSSKTGRPFGSHSDFDVALANSDLPRRARQAGVELRSKGTRTGPLEPPDVTALGLRDLSKYLSRQAGGARRSLHGVWNR
ncbi:hypothetical protein [Streptomyces collinus]|uniref:hypothetical protein n=1 Tax=Streptomyces collinus TaxID=42684 RepID=UPI0036E20F1F